MGNGGYVLLSVGVAEFTRPNPTNEDLEGALVKIQTSLHDEAEAEHGPMSCRCRRFGPGERPQFESFLRDCGIPSEETHPERRHELSLHVTVVDEQTGETVIKRVSDGDYLLIAVSPAHETYVNAFPVTGTHQITIKDVHPQPLPPARFGPAAL